MKWNEKGDRRSVVDDGGEERRSQSFFGHRNCTDRRKIVLGCRRHYPGHGEDMWQSSESIIRSVFLSIRRHSERGKFSGSSRESLQNASFSSGCPCNFSFRISSSLVQDGIHTDCEVKHGCGTLDTRQIVNIPGKARMDHDHQNGLTTPTACSYPAEGLGANPHQN